LESLKIDHNKQSSIVVNKSYQTTQSHIYAINDVINYPNLTSTAYDQNRFAATHLIYKKCKHSLVKHIPTGIYTIPKISSIELTEQKLTTQKIPYEVKHTSFRHLARAQITKQTINMLKILFHRETLKILSIHCFSNHASEIVHIDQAIMTQKGKTNTLIYFINTTFNYPTMTKTYQIAALNKLNRVNLRPKREKKKITVADRNNIVPLKKIKTA